MSYTYTPEEVRETYQFYSELAKPPGSIAALCRRIDLPYISLYSAMRRRSGLPPRQAEYLCHFILHNSDYPDVGRDTVLRICFGDNTWKVIREDGYRALDGTLSFWEWWEDRQELKKDKSAKVGVTPRQINKLHSGYYRKFIPRVAFHIAQGSHYQVEIFHLVGVDRGVVAKVCPIERPFHEMPHLQETHMAISA